MNLKNVDLNLLVALDALLRERNVTRAGRSLGLSQPAMSATLGRLRTLFDDPLLERVGREYRLTTCARELIDPLRTALAAVERTLQRNPAFDPATAKRRFRIAASDNLLIVLCPQIVEQVGRVAPGIQLHIRQVTPEIARDLSARRVDLSLQPSGLLSGFPAQDLFADRWVCVAWKGNHTVKKRLSLAQLCSMPHASFRGGELLAERLLAAHSTEPLRISVSTPSFVALAHFLRNTQLIAVLQYSLFERLRDEAELKMVELPVPVAKLVFGMHWNPAYTDDPAHAWLRGLVGEIAKRECVIPNVTL